TTWSHVARPGPVVAVISAGQPAAAGGVSSFTVTSKEQVLLLFVASVNVYVTVVVLTLNMLPGVWLELTLTVPLQLSVAVGGIQLTSWSQVVRPGPVATVISVGQPAMEGAVLSFTVTVKVQTLLLFA